MFYLIILHIYSVKFFQFWIKQREKFPILGARSSSQTAEKKNLILWQLLLPNHTTLHLKLGTYQQTYWVCTCLKRPLKRSPQNMFSRPIIAQCRSKVLQNAPVEHSAILSTCIKLSPVFKIFVFFSSIFERPLKTGFIVCAKASNKQVC